MEERRRQREQEEARRREEEEEDERRVSLEREMLQRQYELDSLRERQKVGEQQVHTARYFHMASNYFYVSCTVCEQNTVISVCSFCCIGV